MTEPRPSQAPPDHSGDQAQARAEAQAIQEELLGLKPVAHLRAKATALLLFTLILIVGSVGYLLYARGVFEPTQRLVLTADDSQGVAVGMDMTFSGFPIGRVSKIELAQDGSVRILVDVPVKDSHWLRQSSVFTLVKGIVGGTTIKAYTGMLEDAPLPADSVRPVLSGDATAELPQIINSAKEVLGNIAAMTSNDSALGGSLAEVRKLAERMQGHVRSHDTVARLGGDEFIVLLDAVDTLSEIEQVAQRLIAGISEPWIGFGPELAVSASIGIAVFYGHESSAEEHLIQQADQAMYEAKAAGKNQYKFFAEEPAEEPLHRPWRGQFGQPANL